MGISGATWRSRTSASGQPIRMTLGLGGGAAGGDDAQAPRASSMSLLTDDHPWAQAFVVIEALPEPVNPATA